MRCFNRPSPPQKKGLYAMLYPHNRPMRSSAKTSDLVLTWFCLNHVKFYFPYG